MGTAGADDLANAAGTALLTYYAIALVVWLIPSLAILRKIGRSRAWSCLSLVPFIGVWLLLLVLAFARWPALGRGEGVS